MKYMIWRRDPLGSLRARDCSVSYISHCANVTKSETPEAVSTERVWVLEIRGTDKALTGEAW